jgi:adenosylcobinamide-GDP ribazoletransferase
LHARADGQGAAAPSGAPSAAAAPGLVGRSRRARDGLAGAITFLTILPLPAAGAAGLSSTAVWFPVVGVAIGALAGSVRVLGADVLGSTVASALALIVLVVVTGALHQDGLADTADGIGARGSRERRLEVMRDSATGVFGALALVAWALLFVTTVASLDGDRALRALAVACALARWSALAHAAATSPARADGLGASLHLERPALAVATALSAAAALAICGLLAGAAAITTAVIVVVLSVTFAQRTLGGRTGDTLGATVAIVEVAVCLVLVGVWQG